MSGDAAKKKEIGRRFERLGREHEDLRWREDAQKDRDKRPMTTAHLAWKIWEVIKDEDWVFTANTLRDWTRRLWHWDKPCRHPGKSLGTDTQIGISLGVALVYKGTDKLVIDIQPDGDLLFDASALWVAAYHKIPLLAAMYNNRAYYIDWEHQIRMARERNERIYIGMEIDNPPPDSAGLAQSFGGYAEGSTEHGGQVRDALKRAIQVMKKEGTPTLVDTVTQYR
jgi:acetolactate synthase-1/2/3 large subunit